MQSILRNLLRISALGIIGFGVISFISTLPTPARQVEENKDTQTSNLATAESAKIFASDDVITGGSADEQVAHSAAQRVEDTPEPTASPSKENEESSLVARIQNPYAFPPMTFQAVNDRARAALVNILCMSENVALRPVSGSGVIIDPRGVILTNAHVAQYVLLAQNRDVNLSCVVRSGAPARPLWNVDVLYIPPVWIEEHAADITNGSPTGTGEHDYALLQITGPLDPRFSEAGRGIYPSIPVDTREAISFSDDLLLLIAYPAEFVGSVATQFDLHPVSSISPVSELLTFHAKTVDLIAFKGAAEAQSGSSGGPVVNAWGYVTGIITTTSDGATTADRELRAVTTSHIDRDLVTQTGTGLMSALSGDVMEMMANYRATHSPALIKMLMDQILKRQ